jgi:hypothetical protein
MMLRWVRPFTGSCSPPFGGHPFHRFLTSIPAVEFAKAGSPGSFLAGVWHGSGYPEGRDRPEELSLRLSFGHWVSS